MSAQKKSLIYNNILFLYISSIGFQTLLHFPYIGYNLQIPEIIFLFAVGFFISDFFKNPRPSLFKFSSFDLIILIYPTVVLISNIANNGFRIWIEWIGILYLYVVYFLTKYFLSKFNQEEIYQKIYKGFLWSGLLLAMSCIIGFGVLFLFNIENSLAFIYKKYPYFGDIIRVNGFTPSPHMVASILNVSVLFIFSKIFSKQNLTYLDYLLFSIIGLAYLMTFAKVVVLLVLSIVFLFFKINNTILSKNKVVLLSTFYGIAILFYLSATHFIISKKQGDFNSVKSEHFNIGYAVSETENYLIIPTTYSALKKSAFIMGCDNPLLGIGSGNHEFHLDDLRATNDFPNHLPNSPPHSTYLGSFAELGLIGLCSIIFIFFFIAKKLYSLNHTYLSVTLCAIFSLAAVEAISTDILNFRHYWILLAVLSIICEKRITTIQSK